MREFANIDDFTKAFVREDFVLNDAVVIHIDGQRFNMHSKSSFNITEMLMAHKRPILVFVNEAYDKQLVCFWKHKGNSMIPAGVIVTEKKMERPADLVVEMDGEKITIRPDQLIGDIATVKFTSFSSPRELKAKVDTGATISSLHADNYKINGNSVTFTCQPLGPNSVTIPMKTQHAVKSPDGGTHYRPVVELNVKVNGKLMNNVLFNLNDRGNMDQPVLIGQNILQQGKFFVDPTRNESEVQFDDAEKLVETLELDTADSIQEIYQKMLDSNVSFRDLVRYIRGEVIKTDLEG